METTFLVLIKLWESTSPHSFIGVEGQSHQNLPLSCIFRGSLLTHSFLVVPTFSIPLLVKEFLVKMGASISFVSIPLLDPRLTSHSPPPPNHTIWHTFSLSSLFLGRLLGMRDPKPLYRQTSPSHSITKLHQICHPGSVPSLSLSKALGNLRKNLLCPCLSPLIRGLKTNKQTNGTYYFLHNLQLINSVVPLHPIVPNPHTHLSTIPSETSHFSALDLKDVFFSIPLDTQSQNIFSFTWADPDTHLSPQLTWTILPQGFWDSSHLFSQARL